MQNNKLLRSKLRSIPEEASLFSNRFHPRSNLPAGKAGLRCIQPLKNNVKLKMKPVGRSRKGISLYELLMVMAVIASVAAITVPTVNSHLPSLKLTASARIVSAKLRQAQEEAVTTQIQHSVKFYPAASPVTLEFKKKGTPDVILETVYLADNATLSTSFGGCPIQDEIIFSPDGGPNCSGQITITRESSSKFVSVSVTAVVALLSATPSPSPTVSPTPSPTASPSPTISPSPTPTQTPTPTPIPEG